jgi:hypothetical protein
MPTTPRRLLGLIALLASGLPQLAIAQTPPTPAPKQAPGPAPPKPPAPKPKTKQAPPQVSPKPPPAPTPQDDEAILRNLELLMLLDMLKDYTLFYDDPAPKKTK